MVIGVGIIVQKAKVIVRKNGDILEMGTPLCDSRMRRTQGRCPKKCPSKLGCTKVAKLTRLWLKNLFGPSPPSFFTRDIEREILKAKRIEELEETIEERIEKLAREQRERGRY